ncbi:hypothetical protein A2U01_0042400, partial [Trifolium medium]|nr:hypothetical protein [Trifolium medium]
MESSSRTKVTFGGVCNEDQMLAVAQWMSGGVVS